MVVDDLEEDNEGFHKIPAISAYIKTQTPNRKVNLTYNPNRSNMNHCDKIIATLTRAACIIQEGQT